MSMTLSEIDAAVLSLSERNRWWEVPAARRILSGLTADDMGLKVHTPADKARVYQWTAGYKHWPLEQVRLNWIEAQIGTLDQADAAGTTAEYIEAWGKVPYVEAVLADMFGDPARFGRPGPTAMYPDIHASQMARLAVADALGREEAA